jgi:selenocysteine lyase/cysteine desulfurase
MTVTMDVQGTAAFSELTRSVLAALETYANVHRGSGHKSRATTHLYERAGEIVLAYLGLPEDANTVIFCTPRRAELLKEQLAPGSYREVSSQQLGLPLGVRALAVARRALPSGVPVESGGGTARLVAPGWVIWAKAPDRFEPGTPAIVNVIALARALQLAGAGGTSVFRDALTAEVAISLASATEILYRDSLGSATGRELLAALRQTEIGRGVYVPTTEGLKPFINLDNGASTPTFAPIWDTVRQTWQARPEVQQALIGEVQSICAETLGAPADAYDVVFTANTTEAINLVAASLREEAPAGGTTVEGATVVLNTLLEHNSNELPWRTTPGLTLVRLGIDDEGFVDMQELQALLAAYNEQHAHGAQRIALVAVSGASNVLGVYNDLAEISRIAHRYGARLLVDAAQMVAHRAIAMEEWGIDYLAFSGHKVYAPFGAGALVARRGLPTFDPAELAHVRASGEENVGGIAALGKALLLLRRIGFDVIQEEERVLTAQALCALARIPRVSVYGVKDPASPRFDHKGGVIIFDVQGRVPWNVAEELAARGGIGVRSGCHCAHLTVKRVLHIPPLLERFQGVMLRVLPRLSLPGVVRVSLGIENTAQDIDTLVAVLGTSDRQSKAKLGGQMDEFVKRCAADVYAPVASRTV